MLKTRLIKQKFYFVRFLIQLIDVLVIISMGLFAWFIRDWPVEVDLNLYMMAIALGCLYAVIIFPLLGVYNESHYSAKTLIFRQVVFAWFMVVITLALTAFLSKTGEYYSRLWFVMWASYSALLLILVRFAILFLLGKARKSGWNNIRIIIIGDEVLASEVAKNLMQSAWVGIHIIGLISDKITTNESNLTMLGEVSKLAEIMNDQQPDELWITLPLKAEEKIKNILYQLRHSTVTIRMVPDIFNLRLLNHSISEIAGVPVLNLCESPISGPNVFLKWCEDKCIAIFVLLLVMPLMIIVAVAIKLTSFGPVFYYQERVSWNGRIFKMMKFRSMPIDAEKNTGAVWSTSDDKRATWLGGLLRRTSIDELPQFFNVLKGDMSVVGPRPERPVFVEQFKEDIPYYMKKHIVKAGITGWAQVNGFRGNTNLKDRIELDLYYIENWSLWLDIRIILMTIPLVIRDKNAY